MEELINITSFQLIYATVYCCKYLNVGTFVCIAAMSFSFFGSERKSIS